METSALRDYCDAASEAARQAAVVLEQWRHRFAVQEKGRFDLVTDADVAAQQTIQEFLNRRYPDHDFLGEEPLAAFPSPKLGEGLGVKGNRPTWIVDPLDGTTNYVHDCPVYAVSIGLEMGGELVVGVIHDPTRDEHFRAIRGEGAWLNGQRLQTTRTEQLEEALLSTGFPPDLRGQEHTLATWSYFSVRAQSLRRTGCTSLNLAYVAAGRHDGFWGYRLCPWDAAAGVVLIREAGGQVTKLTGSAYDVHAPDLLASNGLLHPALLEAFRR